MYTTKERDMILVKGERSIFKVVLKQDSREILPWYFLRVGVWCE